jgi:phospholipid/cholesterol/gamma-HCH transport system substrate-binding protein
MRNDAVETLIGAAVIIIAVAFVVFTYRSTGQTVGGYELIANMNRVDGVAVGTDVKLSGVKVGSVKALTLNPLNYLVAVHMAVQPGVKIPDDSSAMITQSGLLGGSYVAIAPGGSDKMLPPGGVFHNAQGALDMMGLINKFVGSSSGGGAAPPAAQPAPQP